jgi:hypothetical protein
MKDAPPTSVHGHAHWSTSSYGAHAEDSTLELMALSEHLDRCSGPNRRWFRTRCGADALQRFVTSRLVTTLVVATLLIAFAIGWS